MYLLRKTLTGHIRYIDPTGLDSEEPDYYEQIISYWGWTEDYDYGGNDCSEFLSYVLGIEDNNVKGISSMYETAEYNSKEWMIVIWSDDWGNHCGITIGGYLFHLGKDKNRRLTNLWYYDRDRPGDATFYATN